MSRRILHLVAEILWFCILSGLAFAQLQQPLPKLNYDMTADFFQLPAGEHLVEPAGIAVNSKGTFTFFIAANTHSWNSTLPANSSAALPTSCS